MQGAENYIRWSGDPYDADINVQAVYEAENIQFSDLDEKNGQRIIPNTDKSKNLSGTCMGGCHT